MAAVSEELGQYSAQVRNARAEGWCMVGFVQCYLASTSMDAIQRCDGATPPALKQKIQNRVMTAMQTLQK